jgi:hypothetical protein
LKEKEEGANNTTSKNESNPTPPKKQDDVEKRDTTQINENNIEYTSNPENKSEKNNTNSPEKKANPDKPEEKKTVVETPVEHKQPTEEVIKEARSKYASVGNYYAGLAVVKSHEGRFGYIDHTGAEVLRTEYDFAEDLSGEPAMARVRIKDKVGYINHKGAFVVPMKYRFIDKYFRGLAQVRMLDGESYYIDRQGNHICDIISEYHEGIARIKKGNQIGYIDSYGKVIIPPQFSYGTHFTNGQAEVKIGDKYRVINAKGQCIKDCE